MPSLPLRVTVYEVGPRDGLQNEKTHVPTADKVRYIAMLSNAGFSYVEATSFVSPRAVPQLADASEVLANISRTPGVRYPVLVPNEKGMLRALEAGVTDVAVFTAASESFTRANINATIEESIENFRPVVKLAHENNARVRGYVSTAFGCPYEGEVAPEKVREVALSLLELGAWQVSVGDTIGVGTPNQVYDVMGLLLRDIPAESLAVHFHDTRGTALANVLASLELGIATVDSSSAGLGGCPYAPGACGNLATEDLLYMLNGLGIETGVDLEKVVEASRFITTVLNKPPASRYLQAYLAQCAA
ncbi:MAG: hydroxymethylglutaryl-CoA lyase [Chloroflexota bacterium]|nr:hydroxymethylglutaryl-CoA lyase [Chloroflexota bacterium]MDQ5864176.1 hydroxymethylglutaryl-CoA lyase [Chloroflexota bacterium]